MTSYFFLSLVKPDPFFIMTRNTKKIEKMIPVIAPAVFKEIAPDMCKYVTSRDMFKSTVMKIIDGKASEKKIKKKEDNERTGYSLGDISEYVTSIRLKQVSKKATWRDEDPLFTDSNGPLVYIDGKRNEMRVFATIKLLGLTEKKIIWIGSVINGLSTIGPNVYQIETELYKFAYDRNENDIIYFENVSNQKK